MRARFLKRGPVRVMLRSFTSLKTSLLTSFLLCAIMPSGFCADLPAGRVVWWGQSILPETGLSGFTNGVVESDNEILSNVVAIAAGFALKSDGTVLDWRRRFNGSDDAAASLSNVASIAVEGSSCWAIKQDGTVALWGNGRREAKTIPSLSNITAIAWAGSRSFLALKSDGTVFGFRLDDPGTGLAIPIEFAIDPMNGLPQAFDSVTGLPISRAAITNRGPVRLVTIGGQVLSNVVAMASGDPPLVLKSDGTVLHLGRPGGVYSSSTFSYSYNSAGPVRVDGEVLSNVTALASGGSHRLALKSDGTVVAWGNNNQVQAGVPAGLSNVVSISAVEGFNLNMALKRDGTVVAWGDNSFGQTNVPAGLSNVVAIAAGGWYGTAITTGAIPASVYIRPHGRLEEMEREADIVFKGQVLSTRAMTNVSFPNWAKPHATRFRLISVLKGKPETNELVLWHYTAGPGAWGGGATPSWYQFDTGQCYLVFAAKLERPDYLYTPPADAANRPNEYRQLYRDCVTRTLDARPLDDLSAKQAHWLELNLLLDDTNPTNQLYAIEHLNALSKSCLDSWNHSEDFKRAEVLNAVFPLITNASEQVAISAISCFQVGGCSGTFIPGYGWMPIVRGCSDVQTECIAPVALYGDALVAVANTSTSTVCRVAAIAALSCTRFSVASNSLPRWLADPAEEVRAQAVLLLPDFPVEFCERSLRKLSMDASPVVRAAVADAIGNGRFETLLPTLETLFSTSPVRTNSGPWPHKSLQGEGYFAEVSNDDIHSSAGYALLGFDMGQVGEFLGTNVNDPRFGPLFLCRLAEREPARWLPDAASFLDARLVREKQKAIDWGANPATYRPPLSGPAFCLWNIMYDYLQNLPSADFFDGKQDHYLDLLENSGTTGSREPEKLYELYRRKELNERAVKYRNQCENTFSYDIGSLFNRVDARLTNAPVAR